jgi:anti-sigma regulatory factor (Ser/Thr protein kinase)
VTGCAGTARKHAGSGVSVAPPGTGAAARPVARASMLDLAPLPTAPGSARAHAAAMTREWGLPGLADDCALLVSELVTNACRAAAGIITARGVPPVRLMLTARPSGVLIEVWDASDQMPGRAPLQPGALSGRGLHIIDALAAGHGAYPTEGGGKVVWALAGS